MNMDKYLRPNPEQFSIITESDMRALEDPDSLTGWCLRNIIREKASKPPITKFEVGFDPETNMYLYKANGELFAVSPEKFDEFTACKRPFTGAYLAMNTCQFISLSRE